MTNEEAFEKFYKTITPAVPNAGYEDITKDAAYLSWQAAIAYMQEQSEPVGYTSQKWIDNVSDYCSGVYWKNSSTYLDEDFTVPLFTTPQRQRPLKRLSKQKLWKLYDGSMGYVNYGNAIMDDMQEINK